MPQYKILQGKFEQWLAKAASSCCDIASISGVTVVKQESTGEEQTNITGKGLIALARAVVSAQPAIIIPAYVHRRLDEVIQGRQACARTYAAQPTTQGSDLARCNGTHAHFIEQLKTVAKILNCGLAMIKSPPPAPAASAASGISQDCLHTPFADLSLDKLPEESTGAELDLGDATLTPDSAEDTLAAAKEDGDDASPSFALWCLLKDVHDVRIYIRNIWLEYAAGELPDDFPRFGDYWALFRLFDVTMMMTDKLMILTPARSGSASASLTSDDNPVALLCPAAALLLSQFGARIARAQDPAFDFEYHTLPTEMLTASPSHKLGDILCKYATRIVEHNKGQSHRQRKEQSNDLFSDEFVRGLMNHCTNIAQPLPIWLVLVCQIYMEIIDVLGDNLDCGADSFLQCQRNTAETVQRSSGLRV
ncbi:hypothetical protein LTR53_002432 [Teratosphaeriaceae sp. CCFEE 6253]|nr:hypothetical protein LTR53_002432 [Teratosphaeriaceae sp. CCFEE 6253]